MGIFGRLGEVVVIEREEPLDPGVLQFQEAGALVGRRDVDLRGLRWSENPLEQVEEMNSDVGGHTTRLGGNSLP